MANPAIPEEEEPESQPSAAAFTKALGLTVAGWVVGYLISAVSSLAWFQLMHISPESEASTATMVGTALYGIVFSIVASLVGSSFYRRFALGIGAAIAATIAAASIWSWYETPSHAHWTHAIAFFLMAPAAQFAAIFRRSDD
jgi:CBS domain containing-hemolysin-like protein